MKAASNPNELLLKYVENGLSLTPITNFHYSGKRFSSIDHIKKFCDNNNIKIKSKRRRSLHHFLFSPKGMEYYSLFIVVSNSVSFEQLDRIGSGILHSYFGEGDESFGDNTCKSYFFITDDDLIVHAAKDDTETRWEVPVDCTEEQYQNLIIEILQLSIDYDRESIDEWVKLYNGEK